MKDKSLQVLIIEDSEDDVSLVLRALKKGGYNPVHERVETSAAMIKALNDKQWDIILCDYDLPKFNIPSAFSVLKEANIDIPLIVVTGKIGEEKAVECMRLGAKDYIMTDNLSRLCPAIARELEDANVRNKQKQTEEALRKAARDWQIIFEANSDAICLLDVDQRILRCNLNMAKMFQLTQEETIGRHCWEVIHGSAEPIAECPTTRMKKSLVRETMDMQRGDRWFNFTADPILDETRTIQGVVHIIRDVTERKRTEEALRENEIKYRTLIETTDTGYVIINQDGLVQDANYEYVRLTGHHDLSEILGRSVIEWTAESGKEKNAAAIKACFDKGYIRNLEIDYVDAKGNITPIEINATCIKIEGNTHTITTCRDISERKRTQESLRESEEFYRTIFETTGTSMILIEEDMTISMANEEFVRNSEYSPDEINGRMKWPEIVHPDDLGRMIEQHRLRRTSHGGALPSYEFRYITKTGRVMDTFLTIKLVPGTKKSIASLMNITERKKSEEKLKRTLESLRKAIGTTIQVLVSAVESRDSYTAGHQSRSANLACAIAAEMGLAQEKIEGIRMAGIIHDIGKLSIPAEILSKPIKLTDIEFALIKEHSRSGYEMLKDVESPWPLAEIVYQHHERINGSGYPRNLKGDEILMEARIMAVADVVEAMASHRPYRPTLGIEIALEEIEKNRGILYDNAVADTCLKLFREKGYQLT